MKRSVKTIKRFIICVLAVTTAISTAFLQAGQVFAVSDSGSAGSSIASSGVTVKSVSGSPAAPAIPSKYRIGYAQEQGLDISQWQGAISLTQWKAIKSAGYKFVYVRAAYRGCTAGTLYRDKNVASNVKNAYTAGLNVGVYIFSQALTTSEAKEEAAYLYRTVRDPNGDGYTRDTLVNYVNLPYVMDYEYAPVSDGRFLDGKISKSAGTANALQFANTIKAYGKIPAVYASRSFLETQIDAPSVEKAARVWLAHYTTGAQASSYAGAYDTWQWTDRGTIEPSGLGSLDLDTRYLIGLRFYSRGLSSVKVSWNRVPEAKSYIVYCCDRYSGSYVKSAVTTTANYYNFTGLGSGREYYFRVKALYSSSAAGSSPLTYSLVKGYTLLAYSRVAKVKQSSGIKSAPGASSDIVTVPAGTTMNVSAHCVDRDGALWYRAAFTTGGRTYGGYIKAVYVYILKYGKTTATVNIRKGPGTSYASITKLSAGKKVRILSSKRVSGTLWYYIWIRTNSKVYKGYVMARYIGRL